MLKEKFLGRNPSHFTINPVVKTYIVSEAFLWSAWDFVMPIFGIFIVTNISGATIQSAATGYSIYLINRVIFEIISGRILRGSSDRKKFIITIFGMACLTIAYVGFAFSQNIIAIFCFYSLLGFGLGVASPAKNSLFSIHLDKNKETTEWSLADAVSFICMALATSLGGFVATQYGFSTLFLLASIINLLGMIPYILYLFS